MGSKINPLAMIIKTAIIIFIISIPIASFPSEKKDLMSGSAWAIRREIDRAIDEVKPALVRIFVVFGEYSNGREVKHEASGSGVIITKEGHVITNHHVVRNAKQIVCTLSDKEEIEAELIGTDPLTDIAVIKLRNEKRKEFPAAGFGDSSLVKTGDTVLAMGSPLALSQSVTMGIVSNTEVIMPKFFWPSNKLTLEGEDVGSMVRWIGHDAPIFGGNSGGPLVNLRGEIIGINEISLGISGAIPGNLANYVAERLIKFGNVQRSWIGLEVQPLFRGSGLKKGVVVGGTIEGSPAEKAGFLPGDILMKIDGREINVRFQEEIPPFNQLIMELPVGKKIEAEVTRNGQEITLQLVTQEREYVMSKTVELKQWGITARNISLLNAKEMMRESKDGVLVTTVRTGGPCWEAKPQIESNDVIIEVNGEKIKTVENLIEITKALTKGDVETVSVIVTFERKKERYITLVKLRIDKGLQDRGIEVQKAWLPVAMQVVTKEIANELNIPGINGMRITQVYSNGSAEKAGLKVGDIITAMDGESLQVFSPEDYETFPAMIRQYKIGSTADLTIVRGKERINVAVKLEKAPKPPDELRRYIDHNFELTVRDIAFIDRAQEGLKEAEEGVMVEGVSGGGWASIARLAVGDLIRVVNGETVQDVAAFERIMKEIAVKKQKSVLFQIKRGIHIFYIELEPAWNNN
ncbi:MAG: PDZ domain-containing protein [Nitrospirae bacterium]|nr:PDZ domain-containing protein [Nitrospirota bacterium]